MYNNKEQEQKNIQKAVAIITSSPELTLEQLQEAIAYKKKNNCFFIMSPSGEYEAYSKAALAISRREYDTDEDRQQITIPLHEYLRLKAHETGSAIGIDGGTIDYDCCCDA